MKEKDGSDFWFIGTGDFAALLLPGLAVNFSFSKVITRTPSKANRGMKEEITPVERSALECGFEPSRTTFLASDTSIKNEFSKKLPCGIFVIDFGERITEPFLKGTNFGCLNIHPSLLPKYRGAAPIQRALECGDAAIGVTLFRLVEEMDAGPIISQASEAIPLETGYPEAMNRAVKLGISLANEWIAKISADPAQVPLFPQNHEAATFAPKISKSESQQSFNIPAYLLHNRVRAFNPNPGVWTPFRGKRLKLVNTYPAGTEIQTSSRTGEIIGFDNGSPVVKCGEGALILKRVQPEGKRVMSGEDWINGSRIKTGDLII